MKKINLLIGLLVLIAGVFLVIHTKNTTLVSEFIISNVDVEKTYELTITDEFGNVSLILLTDTNHDGIFEFPQ